MLDTTITLLGKNEIQKNGKFSSFLFDIKKALEITYTKYTKNVRKKRMFRSLGNRP